MLCPVCWHSNAAADRYCGECGSPLVRNCPQCGMPLKVFGLMCPACLADLRHIESEKAEGPPLPVAFCHPLESVRYRALVSSNIVLEQIRKARRLGKVGSTADLQATADIEDGRIQAMLDGLASYYGCGRVKILKAAGKRGLSVNCSWEAPEILVNPGLASILDSSEMKFLLLSTIFTLISGTAPLFAIAADSTRNELKRWAEAMVYSCDRFAAALCPRPVTWLNSVIKQEFRGRDDLPSLLDSLRSCFPEKPARIAELLDASPQSARRLLELSDFHRSPEYRALKAIPIAAMLEKRAVELRGADGLKSQHDSGIDGKSDNIIALKPAGEKKTKSEKNDKKLSADLIYLSSYLNSICICSGAVISFHSFDVSEWARFPRGLFADPLRNRVYISDFEASVILVFDMHGVFQRRMGAHGDKRDFRLHHPAGLLLDPDARLWVADSWNNRVVVFDSRDRVVRIIEGREHPFRRPMALAWDESRGGVWLADTGNSRIVKLGLEGDELFYFGKGCLDYPEGITVDSAGNLVVADTGNGLLRWFSPSGELILDRGTGRNADALLNYPHSVTAGPGGDILVAERGGSGLRLYRPDGTVISIDPPVEGGHGCGFPCGLHMVAGAVRSLGSNFVE